MMSMCVTYVCLLYFEVVSTVDDLMRMILILSILPFLDLFQVFQSMPYSTFMWLIGLCKLSRTNVAFEINIHCNRSNSVKFIHKPWSMNNKYSDHKSDYGIIARLQHACCASYQELTTSAPNLNSKIVVVVNL